MFNSVASYYEEEFDTAVDNMSSLIEPIMIVFMGTMIGGLMIAMYSPIFNVGCYYWRIKKNQNGHIAVLKD